MCSDVTVESLTYNSLIVKYKRTNDRQLLLKKIQQPNYVMSI